MFVERLRGRPHRDQLEIGRPVVTLKEDLAAHRGICRLGCGDLVDNRERLVEVQLLHLDLREHDRVADGRPRPGLAATGTVQPVLVRRAEVRRDAAAVLDVERGGEVRLISSFGREAADHLEVVSARCRCRTATSIVPAE